MSRIVHFEIMAADPARAEKFYSNVFGWQIQKWEGGDYWLVTTGPKDAPGIDGGIGKSQGPASTINVIGVESVDAMAAKVVAQGGQIVMPKMAVPGVGYTVYAQDTEGIVFGMMQFDPSAQ